MQKDIPVKRVASDKEIRMLCCRNVDKQIRKKLILKLHIKKDY